MVNRAEFPRITYNYNRGPLTGEQIREGFSEGNCMAAVQAYYFLTRDGAKLEQDDIMLPEAFGRRGLTVWAGANEGEFYDQLQEGDILYAERLRGRDGRIIYKDKSKFPSEAEWMKKFHMAVVVEKEGAVLWHATYIAGGTVSWTPKEFSFYYKPALARRLHVRKGGESNPHGLAPASFQD